MELIDIIKSSILLFSLLLLSIVFISFGLFKIRNQAKERRLTVKKFTEKKLLPIAEEKVEKLNLKQKELPSKDCCYQQKHKICACSKFSCELPPECL